MKVSRRKRETRDTDELGSGESLGADGGETVEKLRQTKRKNRMHVKRKKGEQAKASAGREERRRD